MVWLVWFLGNKINTQNFGSPIMFALRGCNATLEETTKSYHPLVLENTFHLILKAGEDVQTHDPLNRRGAQKADHRQFVG